MTKKQKPAEPKKEATKTERKPVNGGVIDSLKNSPFTFAEREQFLIDNFGVTLQEAKTLLTHE